MKKIISAIFSFLLTFTGNCSSKNVSTGDAQKYLNQALFKCEKQDYKGAIEDYNQAIKLNPNYAMAYYNRGNAKDDLQDYKGVIEDLEVAKKLAKEQGDMELYNSAEEGIKEVQEEMK